MGCKPMCILEVTPLLLDTQDYVVAEYAMWLHLVWISQGLEGLGPRNSRGENYCAVNFLCVL